MLTNFKKALVYLTVLAFTFTISTSAFAIEMPSNSITVQKQADGTYQMEQFDRKELLRKKSTEATKVSDRIYQISDGTLISQVNEKTLIPVKKVTIDPLNSIQVENAISEYGLHEETAQALRAISQDSKNGLAHLDGEIVYYAPLTTNSTRTYKGYGNKNYYEEKLQYSEHSPSTEVNTAVWGDYIKETIKSAAQEIISGAIEKSSTLAGRAYSIASLLTGSLPSSIPSTADVTHEANKQETKTKVWTYVSEADGYYFGCETEYSVVYFENRFIYNGGSYLGKNTSNEYHQSDDYNAPDNRAYYAYTIGGVTEIISSYTYGGAMFDAC